MFSSTDNLVAHFKGYTKLPGFKRGPVIGYKRLYLGKDHLLMVTSEFFSETYKRFYFRDIQAITVQKTYIYMMNALVLGLMVLLFLMLALMGKYAWNWRASDFGAFCIPFTPLFIWFMVHLVRGSTCKVRIITAAQTEELSTLYRYRTFKSVMKKIEQKVNRE